MVLKTKSCNLLTTPSRSSPRDAIGRVLVDRTAPGEFGEEYREARQAQRSRVWCLGRALGGSNGSARVVQHVTSIISHTITVQANEEKKLHTCLPGPRIQEFKKSFAPEVRRLEYWTRV